MTPPDVQRVAPGAYLVTIEGRRELVYVAGVEGERTAFCRGELFREERAAIADAPRVGRRDAQDTLSAPMPATVLKVIAVPGATVKKGDTLIILEAMKMELPLRAPGDATVKAVHCREGQLVQPETVLVELC